jgi:hypothetical protein
MEISGKSPDARQREMRDLRALGGTKARVSMWDARLLKEAIATSKARKPAVLGELVCCGEFGQPAATDKSG